MPPNRIAKTCFTLAFADVTNNHLNLDSHADDDLRHIRTVSKTSYVLVELKLMLPMLPNSPPRRAPSHKNAAKETRFGRQRTNEGGAEGRNLEARGDKLRPRADGDGLLRGGYQNIRG